MARGPAEPTEAQRWRDLRTRVLSALVIIPAILLCLLGLLIVPDPFLNCCEVFFGMFVAFATIYPGAMPSIWIPLSASATSRWK